MLLKQWFGHYDANGYLKLTLQYLLVDTSDEGVEGGGGVDRNRARLMGGGGGGKEIWGHFPTWELPIWYLLFTLSWAKRFHEVYIGSVKSYQHAHL